MTLIMVAAGRCQFCHRTAEEADLQRALDDEMLFSGGILNKRLLGGEGVEDCDE
jgi:hypothetical protein